MYVYACMDAHAWTSEFARAPMRGAFYVCMHQLGLCCEHSCGQMGGCTLCACMRGVEVGAFRMHASCRVCTTASARVCFLRVCAHSLCVCVRAPARHAYAYALCVCEHCALRSEFKTCVLEYGCAHTLGVRCTFCLYPACVSAHPVCTCALCVNAACTRTAFLCMYSVRAPCVRARALCAWCIQPVFLPENFSLQKSWD